MSINRAAFALVMLSACSSAPTSSGAADAAMNDAASSEACGSSDQTKCGDLCCSPGAVCLTDVLGNKSCAQSCNSSADCTKTTASCCTPNGDAGACVAADPASTTNQLCICATGAECRTRCCAPQTDTAMNPVGPFVCKPVDGKPYDCCSPGQCTSGCCVFATERNNSICEEPCTNNTQCGMSSCLPLKTGTCSGFTGTCEPVP